MGHKKQGSASNQTERKDHQAHYVSGSESHDEKDNASRQTFSGSRQSSTASKAVDKVASEGWEGDEDKGTKTYIHKLHPSQRGGESLKSEKPKSALEVPQASESSSLPTTGTSSRQEPPSSTEGSFGAPTSQTRLTADMAKRFPKIARAMNHVKRQGRH